jgi:hypothetical protein
MDSTLPPGLTYADGFITEEEEKQLVKELDNRTWVYESKGDIKLGRRSQQYGYGYVVCTH